MMLSFDVFLFVSDISKNGRVLCLRIQGVVADNDSSNDWIDCEYLDLMLGGMNDYDEIISLRMLVLTLASYLVTTIHNS